MSRSQGKTRLVFGQAITRRDCLAGIGAVTLAGLTSARASTRNKDVDMRAATALELSAGLRARKWSAREVAEYYFRRIDLLNGEFGRFDGNGALNAFIRIYPDLASRAWKRADRARTYPGWSGVPVALKDVFSVEGKPLTVGTPAFQSHRAPRDCTLWRKWQADGAVLLGHTQAASFISGVTTPQTANPWNSGLIAGGSSGGSAAAVAAGLAPVALGTETAGSLIYPALSCAVTTLKPSLGLLSLAGVYPGDISMDVAGPLARSAADCAWVLATLAGVDAEDAMTADQQGHAMAWPDVSGAGLSGDRPLQGLRFLVAANERYVDRSKRSSPKEFEVEVDPRVASGFESFLQSLTALGAEIVRADIPPELGQGGFFDRKEERFGNRSARTLVQTADDAQSTWAVRYGYMKRATPEEWQIAVTEYKGIGRSFESEEARKILAMLTPQMLQMAKAAREELRSAWEALLSRHRCDAHVYLEVGSPLPPRLGMEDTKMPSARRKGVRPNDLGWPVLGMPVSRVDGLDVPVSAQIMGRRWQDHRLLAWGMAWQRHHPELVRMAPTDPKFGPRAQG